MKYKHQESQARQKTLIALVILCACLGSYSLLSGHAATPASPPASGGYFQLIPPSGDPGSTADLNLLPNDSQAAAMVHPSTWEPRAANYTANQTKPPTTFTTGGVAAYDYNNVQSALFGRVDGQFTGTTDEIIQWTAAKWGLSDEIVRAEAVQESNWYQNTKTFNTNGKWIGGTGYGDFGSCDSLNRHLPSPYNNVDTTLNPSSFGILQDKWCAFTDHPNTSTTSTPNGDYDGWPWSEQSTAYSLDLYGAITRACYEGWNVWINRATTGYHGGDIWGCVGNWFSGDWYGPSTTSYLNNVHNFYNNKPWLAWPDQSGSIAPPVTGDLNNDNHVTILDLSILLSHWKEPGATPYDLNGNNLVDIFDLSILLSHNGA